MVEIHEIFRAGLKAKLGHGDQTRIAKKTGINLKTINHIVTGEHKGSEDDRRAIAAALGYEYEAFLNLGRRALGLPVARKEAPPGPEVAGYLEKARAVIEAGGKEAETLKNMLDILKE